MHKTIFTPVTPLRGAVLIYLLPIFVYCYYFAVPLFLENDSIASHYFSQMFLALFRGLGAILRYFGARFGVCCSIFQSCSLSYLTKFCTAVFSITMTVKVLGIFPSTYLSAGGIKQYFWA